MNNGEAAESEAIQEDRRTKHGASDSNHGTPEKYARGCRCRLCVVERHATLNLTLPAHPKCFEGREQWIAWCEMAELSRISKANFCMDCTPDYKREMDKSNLCEYPATTFEWSERENDWATKLTVDELRQKSAVDWFVRLSEKTKHLARETKEIDQRFRREIAWLRRPKPAEQ